MRVCLSTVASVVSGACGQRGLQDTCETLGRQNVFLTVARGAPVIASAGAHCVLMRRPHSPLRPPTHASAICMETLLAMAMPSPHGGPLLRVVADLWFPATAT